MKPYAEVAVGFASALVNGDFAHANTLLAPNLRRKLTPDILREEFCGMFRGYSSGEPQSAHCDEEGQTEEWPAKRAGDVGWAYVGILGEGFVEAVTVIVADVKGKLLIREVEWGRP